MLHRDDVWAPFIKQRFRQGLLRHIVLGTFLRFHRHKPLLFEGEQMVLMPKDHLDMTGKPAAPILGVVALTSSSF